MYWEIGLDLQLYLGPKGLWKRVVWFDGPIGDFDGLILGRFNSSNRTEKKIDRLASTTLWAK